MICFRCVKACKFCRGKGAEVATVGEKVVVVLNYSDCEVESFRWKLVSMIMGIQASCSVDL